MAERTIVITTVEGTGAEIVVRFIANFKANVNNFYGKQIGLHDFNFAPDDLQKAVTFIT